MIQERVKAGLARAKAAGKVIGRPRVSADVEAQVRTLHAKGVGKVRLAKQLGIGVSAVQRIMRAT
jgi:DNA invertase Pin-like site-specific DNA recombinase